ncbi:MAG TPA: DUF6391 domain-containing protein [Anaerolineaceae bacterium]|nr:DUF6391 domain-containing protein [Anaerolineaceae bacterium]
MTMMEQILTWKPILQTRRNHALEHATLKILAMRNPNRFMAGYSNFSGIFVLGKISTEELQEALSEAEKRLRKGEHSLAIHPGCGTNLSVAGMLAGFLAWLGSLRTPKNFGAKLGRLPNMMALATIGVLISQPLGPWLQEHVTTEADLGTLRVIEIARLTRQEPVTHHIKTEAA